MTRTALLTAMGTRGDVQPFVALGLHLQASRGWRVVLAAPPEFRHFVSSYGLEHEDIGISLQHAISSSPQGRALRTAGVLNAFQATSDFFRLPLLESWFASLRRLLLVLRPDVLLLTTFVAMSGAAALPAILGLPTRVALAHTIPMHATGEFGMPLAGTGFSAPAAWLNRLQWGSLEMAVARTLHMPRAQAIVDAACAEQQLRAGQAADAACQRQVGDSGSSDGAVDGSSSSSSGPMLAAAPQRILLGRSLASAQVPTLYVWSGALLPKPADWPAHCHVVGSLLLRRAAQPPADSPTALAPATPRLPPPAPAAAGAAAAAPAPADPVATTPAPAAPAATAASPHCTGLPPALQRFLGRALRAQLAVVYIGLGSMLETVFDRGQVHRLIESMVQAVQQAGAKLPLCAVIHNSGSQQAVQEQPVVVPGGRQQRQQPEGALPSGCCFMLQQPVPHELLLPQCDFVVHHGGAGTTQAALLAGKPALVVPCVPSSDQPFWADLIYRRGLGPAWFPVRQLTTARLAAGILSGVRQLDSYAKAAEKLAYEMAQEDGVSTAADILESSLL